jgi:uncharacterized protein YukE
MADHAGIEVNPPVLRTQAAKLDHVGADLKSLGAQLHRSATVVIDIARHPDVADAHRSCAETWARETEAIAAMVTSFADRLRRSADNYEQADEFRLPARNR